MLAVSGRLNRPRRRAERDGAGRPGDRAGRCYKPSQWQVARDPAEHDRRSIYLIAKRNLRLPFLEVFDAPASSTSCPRRESSTHAPQALELLNGRLANELAAAFADRLRKRDGRRPASGRRPRLSAGPGPSPDAARGSPRAGVPPRRAARRIHPGPVQPQWVPLCPLNPTCPHARPTRTRREFIRDGFCGFGGLALASLLHEEQARAAIADPLAPKPQHHPARARSVIFLFMAGGPSHLETFDPKPLLNRLHGQTRPKEFGEAKYQFVSRNAKLLGTRRTFRKYGESGIEVSDLFPHLSELRGRPGGDPVVPRRHGGPLGRAVRALHRAGSCRAFPSMGSWVCYGLGSESRLAARLRRDAGPRGALEAGQPMYMHGFLPAVYQPTMFRPGDRPVLNLDLPPGVGLDGRRRTLRLIRELNEATLDPA